MSDRILGTDHYWRDWTIEDGMVYTPPDWNVAIANGSRFTFLKGADGASPSHHFDKAFPDARASGLLVGSYVWPYPKKYISPKTQAQFWYEVHKSLDCPIGVDFELYKYYVPDWRDIYDLGVYYLELDPTRNLGLYTNYWYYTEHGSPDPIFAEIYKFNWAARYFYEPPQLYAPWNRTDIWQFSGLGDPAKYGIRNGKLAVDENWWMGDMDSLKRFFNQDSNLPPEPPKPPAENRTIQIKIKRS